MQYKTYKHLRYHAKPIKSKTTVYSIFVDFVVAKLDINVIKPLPHT